MNPGEQETRVRLRQLCCVAGLLLPMWHASAQPASISVCESNSLTQSDAGLFGPQGRPLRLIVDDVPAEGCSAVDVPVPADAIRWFTLSDIPVSAAPPVTLGLQGDFSLRTPRVSDVLHAQADAQGEPGYIPFFSNMLPHVQPRVFGAEERASFNGGKLVCAPGRAAAGVQLRAVSLWEQLPDTALVIDASGSGEFGIALADAQRERQERPLSLGAVSTNGDARTQRFVLPRNDERWSSLTLSCPMQAAELTLTGMKLEPALRATPGGRATWLWNPELWRSSPETIWALAADEGLQTLFITVPVSSSGDVTDANLLAAFVADARARGIAVWAVVGDRADVLPENLPALLTRAEAYAQFNAEHPQAPLAGMQLDIEPYLLPGVTLAPDYWRERYIATIAAVHETLHQRLPLDLVMPVWWGTHPAWGSRLLEALQLPGLSLTVMNYRTNPDALRAGAMPFFVWGEATGQMVRMALEQGRVGVNAGNGRDETRLSFQATTGAGELWLLSLDGVSLLLLLDEPHAGLPGQAYRKVDERVIGIGHVSFAGAPRDLDTVARTLEKEWSAWSAFAGLAIHGLDQQLGAD